MLLCLHQITNELPQSPLGKKLRELYAMTLEGNIVEQEGYKQAISLVRYQRLIHSLTIVNMWNYNFLIHHSLFPHVSPMYFLNLLVPTLLFPSFLYPSSLPFHFLFPSASIFFLSYFLPSSLTNIRISFHLLCHIWLYIKFLVSTYVFHNWIMGLSTTLLFAMSFIKTWIKWN